MMRVSCLLSTISTSAGVLPPSTAVSQEAAPASGALAACPWQPLELTFTADRDCGAPFDFEFVRPTASFEGTVGEKLNQVFWE